MAIEYKDDWLTGFSNMLSSAANITATNAQLKTGIQNQQFSQQMQKNAFESEKAKGLFTANLGMLNAAQEIGKSKLAYEQNQGDVGSLKAEIDTLKADRVKPVAQRNSLYKTFLQKDYDEKIIETQAKLDNLLGLQPTLKSNYENSIVLNDSANKFFEDWKNKLSGQEQPAVLGYGR